MRRIFVPCATAGAALALAVPAVAATPTLQFRKWAVDTDNGTAKVAGGKTYSHCGANRVLGINARGTVSGAKKGDAYKVVWRQNGHKIVTFTEHWPRSDGKVKVGTLSNKADDVPDGTYKVTAKQNGEVLGSSSVKLKTKTC